MMSAQLRVAKAKFGTYGREVPPREDFLTSIGSSEWLAGSLILEGWESHPRKQRNRPSTLLWEGEGYFSPKDL
jgi:hypothetical protein